jgi:pseudouridine-5'-phosphate glycosidase/pseudouridine kinase
MTWNLKTTHATLRRFSTVGRTSTLRWQFPPNLLDALRKDAPIDVHPEVQNSLATRQAVVALESTIITHGMSQPINLETARSVERIVRSTGAVPATIGVLGGRIKIGLEPHELEHLADTKSNPSVEKLSRRDIAAAVAQKRDGGTTCSATLVFAALAGIKASNIHTSTVSNS